MVGRRSAGNGVRGVEALHGEAADVWKSGNEQRSGIESRALC